MRKQVNPFCMFSLHLILVTVNKSYVFQYDHFAEDETEEQKEHCDLAIEPTSFTKKGTLHSFLFFDTH